ncbi:MAG: MFS transporter [Proteobacteria bacterium]|nr:MFS transporter [Pseudomonadota bacterium]
MANQSTDRKLSKKTLFFYGLTEMPLRVAGLPLLAFVPNFYTQDLGVSVALMAWVLFATRMFDGIIDPLIGHLSDRTTSRWGRRRPWIVAGVPISMLGTYMIFFPGDSGGIGHFFIWMVVLWVGWTMITIPYYAWAAELSSDYNERSVITGWRTALGEVANVLSKLIPTIAVFYFAFGGTPAVVTIIGIMLLFLLPTTVGLTVTNVPDPRVPVATRMPFLKGVRLMMRNGPFKRLISAFFINYVGTAISTATLVYYVRGVLGQEKLAIAVLLGYYVVNLCSIPFWVWISARIGKHRAWIYGLLTFTCVNPLLFLLGEGDSAWMVPILMITGFAGGTFYTMTNSMKADVIDLDTLQSGENRAGIYFAAWSLAIKLALSIGPLIGLGILGLVGLESAPGLVTDPDQRLALQLVFILGPPVFFSLAAAVAWNYPITEARHKRLRAALERRNSRRLAASFT